MASDYSFIDLKGRLTRDAELAFTQNGASRLSFSVAVGKEYKEKKSTTFFDCVLWSKSAEKLKQYLVKGREVNVHGTISMESWTDSEGATRGKMVVTVNQWEGLHLGNSPKGGNGGYDSQRSNGNDDADYSGYYKERFDDDIPF